MEAATAGGSAFSAAALLQQHHFSRAEALTYAGEERASTSARTNKEMPNCIPDAREMTHSEVDVHVIPQEEMNFCWRYAASRALPAAAGLTTAASVAAPTATVSTDAATAPAPAVFAAGSPAAGAFSSPPGVAAHSPGAHTAAATFPGPPTNAAPSYPALPSRRTGAAVTASEVKGVECVLAARTPCQKVSHEETSQHQQERVHAACGPTGAGPSSQIDTSSSYETSLRRWLCSSKEHASVDETPLIHRALPPEPSRSAAAAASPPKTTACADVSAGDTVSAAARAGGTPATAVSAAAAAVSADASAPPATASAYAAFASAWSGCAPAAAIPSVAPATAGAGVGGRIRSLAARADSHFPSQPEQLCAPSSMFFAFAAGAPGDVLRRADFALAGSEAGGTEKRHAAHVAATGAAADALDPFRVSGGAAGAAAAVGAVETNCPQCAAAASCHAGDTPVAAADSGSGLAALITVAAANACRRRQQKEYPSATVTTDAAARARRRCTELSTTPVAGAVVARSSHLHSHRAGWQGLRGSAAAAAAVVCLVCATAAEAIICRIDASDGLLAAAVAAGSAMPTAEVFSFPLCRLPYLVNSDVPARDAPHVGLYAGGSIEIDLELLPAETYANNMPLSEPRFYKSPSAAGLPRQEGTHQNEGAATAASSPKRKQQQTDLPFRVHAPTAQQHQQHAVAPAAVGSFTRELVAIVGPDVAGTPDAAIASSSTAAKLAAAREGARREEEAAAALWGTATGRDTAAATGGGSALEGATEGRRKQKGTAQAEQEKVASEGLRGGKEQFVEARAGSRRTVPTAWGRSTAGRAIDEPQAPKDEILQEEHGEKENAEGLSPFHFNGANQRRHSPSASEDAETSQKIFSHRWRDAAAENSGVYVSVEAAAFDASRPFNDRTVAAKSIAASGRSVAAASSSICPASEENIPVTTLSGSTRVVELPSPLLSLHSSLFLDLAASFASNSVRQMWSCVRSYLALFAYSVAAAADLFFGIQASPLLLPASNRASTRAHIPFTDADRAALPKQQPTARSALPFSLLFSSLYSATRFFVLPASNAPRQAALHHQEEEEREQQEKQWHEEAQNREKEQQQFSKSAGRRDTVTERDDATTDAAVEGEEEAKTQKESLVDPHPVVAGGTRALSFERDRDVGAVWLSEAPNRILQGIQSESLSRLHGLADEAERQDAKGQVRLVGEEEGDDYEEDEEGRSTDQDDVAEGQRSESHAAGKPEVLDAPETKASYLWKNKAMQDRGETRREEVARGKLPIAPYLRFTASYGGGDFRDARSLQQQQKPRQQIAPAAAAWQRQLREDNQHAVDDPLVYTVNNTYVLVMSHFQYMLYQQDSGWLRSFTATDGIVANSYVPAFKRLAFTGPKLHARVEVPKLDRYAVVLLNADGLDLRLKGRITFLNPGNQQLSVEQISLPKLLLFLLLLHLLTVAVLAIVMLSFRRRRWTRVHFLILSNLLLCALCFALDRSQTIFFEEHGQRNPVLWLAARVCRKLQDIMALMAFILIALGWKTLRSQLTRIEVQFVAGLCVISLYLGVFEIILGGFQGTRYILHALGYVCVLVAINFNLALLHSHIMDAGITPTTSDLYHKYDAFRLYRGIFFLYLIKPVSLIFFKLSFLNPIYEQLLSWDEWIFVFANNAIDYSIFLAVFPASAKTLMCSCENCCAIADVHACYSFSTPFDRGELCAFFGATYAYVSCYTPHYTTAQQVA